MQCTIISALTYLSIKEEGRCIFMKSEILYKFVYSSIRQLYCYDITDIGRVPPLSRATYTKCSPFEKSYAPGLSKFAQTFAVRFLNASSIHTIYINYWGSFPSIMFGKTIIMFHAYSYELSWIIIIHKDDYDVTWNAAYHSSVNRTDHGLKSYLTVVRDCWPVLLAWRVYIHVHVAAISVIHILLQRAAKLTNVPIHIAIFVNAVLYSVNPKFTLNGICRELCQNNGLRQYLPHTYIHVSYLFGF